MTKGIIDVGEETAYTRPHKRQQGPTRRFNRHQYGDQEARCKSVKVGGGKRAQDGHTAQGC